MRARHYFVFAVASVGVAAASIWWSTPEVTCTDGAEEEVVECMQEDRAWDPVTYERCRHEVDPATIESDEYIIGTGEFDMYPEEEETVD
tara:strand:- start:900 stop:1166 length:267 start_codon:yes stop_codon:yes gene_type:complete